MGWEVAIRGMRNPMNSWEKSDGKQYSIGIPEYASRKMTLDEIEKKLGYKVKIINKEKNDGNGKKM